MLGPVERNLAVRSCRLLRQKFVPGTSIQLVHTATGKVSTFASRKEAAKHIGLLSGGSFSSRLDSHAADGSAFKGWNVFYIKHADDGMCLVNRCPRSALGRYLCREHSGLYRCVGTSAETAKKCEAISQSVLLGGTCPAHSASSSWRCTSTSSSGEASCGSPHFVNAACLRHSKLAACAFANQGETCTKNGYQTGVDGMPTYCTKHLLFTHLRTTLEVLDHGDTLDPSRLPAQPEFKLRTGGVNWQAEPSGTVDPVL